jgi:hypothetical protein
MALTARAHSEERRLFGIDLGTVVPAVLVLALAAVMSIVLPSLDSSTAYRDQIHTGDTVQLAAGITLVPASGWDLASGALVGKARSAVGSTGSTELVHGSVEFSVQVAPFAGSPSRLLSRINKISHDLHRARGRAAGMTDRYAVRTRQGEVGVAENFTGVAREGSVVAFVFAARGQASPREGVEIVAAGPTDAMSRLRDDIVDMIESIRSTP